MFLFRLRRISNKLIMILIRKTNFHAVRNEVARIKIANAEMKNKGENIFFFF